VAMAFYTTLLLIELNNIEPTTRKQLASLTHSST
jgi:hypothetical protein